MPVILLGILYTIILGYAMSFNQDIELQSTTNLSQQISNITKATANNQVNRKSDRKKHAEQNGNSQYYFRLNSKEGLANARLKDRGFRTKIPQVSSDSRDEQTVNAHISTHSAGNNIMWSQNATQMPHYQNKYPHIITESRKETEQKEKKEEEQKGGKKKKEQGF
jgi:hypothetical protein